MKSQQTLIQINNDIKDLEKERVELQKQCKHKNTMEVNYQWMVGSTVPAIVCCDCDKLIEFVK